MHAKYLTLILLACTALCGCHNNDYTPKPQAYIRIDMPVHRYVRTDTLAPIGTTLPFSFEMNADAEMTLKKKTKSEVWVDVAYPQWDGVAFLSYKHLRSAEELRGQTDTSLRLLESHYQFASGVEEDHFEGTDRRVFGTTYRLGGNRVASTYQFWVTDSAHSFLRGALYLNRTPNNDSLAPVLEYIQADLDHLIETVVFK